MVKLLFYWGTRVIAAFILLQTLFFKFSGSAESVYIFSTLGMEPWGRIGIGVLELLAAILLLITRVSWIGALLSLGLMLGAIGMHLTLLGIVVQGDGGYLFILAVVVVICSVFVLWTDRERAIAFLENLNN
jgi:hypothetical protein